MSDQPTPTITRDDHDQVLIDGQLAGEYFVCDTCGPVIDVDLTEATADQLRALAEWLDQQR